MCLMRVHVPLLLSSLAWYETSPNFSDELEATDSSTLRHTSQSVYSIGGIRFMAHFRGFGSILIRPASMRRAAGAATKIPLASLASFLHPTTISLAGLIFV